jgi:two-component system sensor histidine kinase FlrB
MGAATILNESPTSIDPRSLEAAFSLFNEASAQLASAYQDLQGRVERLTAELAVANGELRRQYLQKEALSQRLKLLLDALPGGVVVLDADERVIEANPAAATLLGGAPQGRPWREVAAEALTPAGIPNEWDVSGAAGGRRVAISESPFDPAGGRILLLQDITDAVRLQRQLEQHKRLSAMGEMAAGLAHQLRTPLATALLHAANLSRADLKDADRQRFSERIRERLHFLERMIQEMLMFVRGQAAGDETFATDALLAELAQIIEPQMAGKGVRFRLEDGSGGSTLRGGRKALAGALLNLLDNALRASEPGGEVVMVVERDGGTLKIEIRDTGCGVPPELHDRLFEPFFTTRHEGTGLGLAIVRSVVEAHGGRVSFVSVPGGGSAFTVVLPSGEADMAVPSGA